MWWLFAVVANAAQVLLKVEPDELVEGQSGHANLLVVSTSRNSLRVSQVPRLPAGDGLSVGFDGQSNQYRSVNNQITQILSFSYRVTALRAGEWQIGPVVVVLDDGSRVQTEAVTVSVKTRSEVDQRPPVVATCGFDVERAYEGQVVLYEFRVEARNPDARVEWLFPDFEGLRQPQEGAPEARTYLIEDPEGAIAVSEGAVPLIATGTGTRDYQPAVANVQTPMGGNRRSLFRRMRTDPWATEPATLTVEPLPSPPADFSGLVGDFEIESDVARSAAEVGQSVAWTVQIVGDGALEGYALPGYEAPGMAVYDNDSSVSARLTQDGYLSAARFERTLVPTKPGPLEPPPLKLVTFSPSRGEFVTHEITLPAIAVRPGREGSGEVTSFAPDVDPDALVESVDMTPRAILTSGRATAWRLTGWLPVALGLTALPGLLWWLRELVGVVREWWEARQTPVEVEQTPQQVLDELPREAEARQAAYETALRLAIAERPDDEELQRVFHDFLRARFADGQVDRDLEVRIERVVRKGDA